MQISQPISLDQHQTSDLKIPGFNVLPLPTLAYSWDNIDIMNLSNKQDIKDYKNIQYFCRLYTGVCITIFKSNIILFTSTKTKYPKNLLTTILFITKSWITYAIYHNFISLRNT